MAADEEAKAGLREWVGLAVLALPTFLVAIDVFVLMLALPKLSTSLGASSNQQLWVMDIYGFLLAGFTVTMGTLGDRIGRRRLLLIGSAAFAAVSVLTAYSTSPGMLIVSRALLGIAGATLMPSTLALITNMFHDAKQRAAAFGMWGATFTVGMIVGPIMGGLLLSHFWWGSVFLIAVPFMALLLVVGPRVLPEYRNGRPARLDPPSVVLALLTMLPVIYGIKQIARDGVQVWPTLAILLGIACGVAFARRQKLIDDPILDLSLFRNATISATLASQLAYSVVGGGVMFFMMLYFQLVGGLSTVQSGLAMIPGMAAATVGFMTLPRLASKIRPAYLIAAGMAVNALVLLVFSRIGATGGTAVLIIGFAVFSFCGSPLVALGTNFIVGSAPPAKAGSAGSVAQMSNEFGGTLGGALLGVIGYAVYRSTIADAVPTDVPAAAAAAAKDSLAGAAASADQLPSELGARLLAPAHAAFADALNTVAGIGALLLAGAATLLVVYLKHLPPIGQEPAGAGQADALDAVTN